MRARTASGANGELLYMNGMKRSQNDVLEPFFKNRTETALNLGSLCLCHFVFYLNMEL